MKLLTADQMADAFLNMLNDHHPDCEGEGIPDMFHYVAVDMILAARKHGVDLAKTFQDAKTGADLIEDLHGPVSRAYEKMPDFSDTATE